ncbi:hypothetical protein ACFZAE_07455 [Streptomyces scabiei]|uniref:hypothetical protein n=1 Tax=Streptomyces scabiei TaxID=1930 RepID=UPI0036E72EBF
MHRPTTTATLLVTVAVSALTGCVTPHHPPPRQPSPLPSRPSEPRPEGTTETQIVEAPAREALRLVGPPREPTPSAPPEQKPPSAPPVTGADAAPTPAAPPPPRDERPAPRERQGPPPDSRPHVEIPPLPKTVPTTPAKNSDVCALGHRYGGWGKDTPQAVICKDVYGR